MRRLRFSFALAAGALAMSAGAGAAPTPAHPHLVLRAGDHGAQVWKLQRLLGGHDGYVFSGIKPLFTHDANGLFGERTASAVRAFKFRAGYPRLGQCGSKQDLLQPVAGVYLFQLLTGQKTRPACWVALAQQRLQIAASGVTPLAWKIKQYELSQLGVHETGGANRGPAVDQYERHFGLLAEPWCAIFQNYAFWKAGYHPSPFVTAPFNPYYVPSIVNWARARNYLSAKPKVGSLVAFLDDGGHIGYVIAIVGSSGYTTVEGNASDSVKEVFHPWNDRLRVFINIPRVA